MRIYIPSAATAAATAAATPAAAAAAATAAAATAAAAAATRARAAVYTPQLLGKQRDYISAAERRRRPQGPPTYGSASAARAVLCCLGYMLNACTQLQH